MGWQKDTQDGWRGATQHRRHPEGPGEGRSPAAPGPSYGICTVPSPIAEDCRRAPPYRRRVNFRSGGSPAGRETRRLPRPGTPATLFDVEIDVMKTLAMGVMAGVLGAAPAMAGPVVREASGANAAAIQAAVDQFRADLGGANNGNAVGTQPGGRREINWDGGGAAANVALDPIPMTRFIARGVSFVTPGSGFEISGQPLPEFGELNATYPGLFAAFSSPRIFSPLNSNVMDVLFHVPGDTTIAAGVSGFGAVFTDVDLAGSTRLQFYTPDGVLLYERAVPVATGNETLSFLGVSFNAGELVGRVRIVSGNAALGANETAALDVVAMDDFIFAEPVTTAGLTLSPGSTTLFRTGRFDLVVALTPWVSPIVSGRFLYDGADVTGFFLGCLQGGTLTSGGYTFRCPLPGNLLGAGDHVLQVEAGFADGSRRRNAIKWVVVSNTEP